MSETYQFEVVVSGISAAHPDAQPGQPHDVPVGGGHAPLPGIIVSARDVPNPAVESGFERNLDTPAVALMVEVPRDLYDAASDVIHAPLRDHPNRLRSVAFIDPGESFIHVTQRLLFNGEPAKVNVPHEAPIEVSGGRHTETVLSFVVDAASVVWGEKDDDGKVTRFFEVGGHPVYVPVGPDGEPLWERIDTNGDLAYPVNTKSGDMSHYPASNEEPEWVLVTVLVDEVLFTHA